MPRQAEASQSRSYNIELAQTPAADLLAPGLRPLHMDETPQSGPAKRAGGFQISRVVEWLDNAIPLPNDLRSFAIYLGVLMAVAAGMMIHVLLAAQILQAEVELDARQAYYTVVKRQNGELLWRIGRATNLEHVQAKASAAGYRPIDERQFVEVGPAGVTIRNTDGDTESVRERYRGGASALAPLPAGERRSQPLSASRSPSLEDEAPAEAAPASSSSAAPRNGVGASPEGAGQRTNLIQEWRTVLAPRGQATEGTASDALPAGREVQTEMEQTSPAWLDQVADYVNDLPRP